MNPKDLIARLTCKVCGGLEVVSHMVINHAGYPASQSMSCPACTNLDDEKDIMEIVDDLNNYHRWSLNMSCAEGTKLAMVICLAQAYVKTAEYCALRGLKVEPWPHNLDPRVKPPAITQTLAQLLEQDPACALPRMLLIAGDSEYAEGARGCLFHHLEHHAVSTGLDLAGAVEEVMHDRT